MSIHGILTQRDLSSKFAECVDDIWDYISSRKDFSVRNPNDFELLVKHLEDKGHDVDRDKVKEYISREMRKNA